MRIICRFLLLWYSFLLSGFSPGFWLMNPAWCCMWTYLLCLVNLEAHTRLQTESLCRISSTDTGCRKINWSPNTGSFNFLISLVSGGRFSIGLLSYFFSLSPPHSGSTANPQHSSWLSPELTRNILIDSIYRLKNLGLEAANWIFPFLAPLHYLSIYLSVLG